MTVLFPRTQEGLVTEYARCIADALRLRDQSDQAISRDLAILWEFATTPVGFHEWAKLE